MWHVPHLAWLFTGQNPVAIAPGSGRNVARATFYRCAVMNHPVPTKSVGPIPIVGRGSKANSRKKNPVAIAPGSDLQCGTCHIFGYFRRSISLRRIFLELVRHFQMGNGVRKFILLVHYVCGKIESVYTGSEWKPLANMFRRYRRHLYVTEVFRMLF
jgi:hypothetical protein